MNILSVLIILALSIALLREHTRAEYWESALREEYKKQTRRNSNRKQEVK